ncbi:hypothetical protein [Helicobacter sp. 10-6591]|uniref:hypothetical protein n=1 Tax=Helicobacter sp. 10-6591 TaxID=2004998 RepID=UPI000DCF2557|nr:hypothetical protein [Helicobacter sp. 10-6591]RAX54821.1 hypothetical protein CCY97_05470 [Helicobacter sp. 10-6591]
MKFIRAVAKSLRLADVDLYIIESPICRYSVTKNLLRCIFRVLLSPIKEAQTGIGSFHDMGISSRPTPKNASTSLAKVVS